MPDSSEQQLSQEEYLKIHLSNLDKTKTKEENTTQQPKVNTDNSRLSDLQFFAFDTKDFPCSDFYQPGTTIQIRAAQVKEIQAYSTIEDTNYHDIVEKMNDMLSACVRVKYMDGSMGSYLDIRDPDRFFLIFVIRELTFQQGNNLSTKTSCSCGNEELNIELIRENFRFFKIDDKIVKFYNHTLSCFTFETRSGSIYNLAPPTIGLQKSFTDYIIKENAEKRKPNLSFLKIVPFLLYDRTSITIDGVKAKLIEFQTMSNMDFQFLNQAVEKLSFGIKEIVKNCNSCGVEVRSEMIFPDGPSAVFVNDDAFEKYIKE